jgi:long-chain fatty acid transport protein
MTGRPPAGRRRSTAPSLAFPRALAATAFVSAALSGSDARAGGLYFSDRGVRPLARGGAFVAGADDLGAVWYNPAGLADAGTSFLLDASWLHFASTFTRRATVTDANGAQYPQTFAPAQGSTPVLPLPTLGFSYAFDAKQRWTGAIGAFAPYTAVASYPQTAASRYSLVSLDGSALVNTGLWLAYKPIEQVRIGIGVEALVGTFATSIVMNANPQNRLLGAPEDPSYDAFSQLNVGPIFAPSGNAGVTVIPEKHVRVGVSGQLPTHVSAPATVQVRLPNAAVFDNASVHGDSGSLAFNLPGVFRAGVEVRPVEPLRVELAYVREFWSNHTEIDVYPSGITINGITGFPPGFKVGTIVIPRHFQDSNSLRLGGEYTLPVGAYRLEIRGGVAVESSAVPAAYESPLTVDLNKLTTSLGLGIRIGAHWRFDGVYAHVFGESTTVSPSQAAVPAINPVQGNPTPSSPINAGTYTAQADIVGFGLNYGF